MESLNLYWASKKLSNHCHSAIGRSSHRSPIDGTGLPVYGNPGVETGAGALHGGSVEIGELVVCIKGVF